MAIDVVVRVKNQENPTSWGEVEWKLEAKDETEVLLIEKRVAFAVQAHESHQAFGETLGAVSEGQQMFFLPMPEDGQQAELMRWWLTTAYEDFQASTPKTEEYGAHDLEIMGAVLVLLSFKEKISILAEAQAAPIGSELACWFYVLGKVARLVSDYMAQRPGKPDTWHDITVYSMMARRIQEHGRWP